MARSAVSAAVSCASALARAARTAPAAPESGSNARPKDAACPMLGDVGSAKSAAAGGTRPERALRPLAEFHQPL